MVLGSNYVVFIIEMVVEDFDVVMDVNVWGVWLVCWVVGWVLFE